MNTIQEFKNLNMTNLDNPVRCEMCTQYPKETININTHLLCKGCALKYVKDDVAFKSPPPTCKICKKHFDRSQLYDTNYGYIYGNRDYMICIKCLKVKIELLT